MKTYDRARMHRALDAVLSKQQVGMRRIHKELIRAKLGNVWSTIHALSKEDGTQAFNTVL
jgi:hypothetical protein